MVLPPGREIPLSEIEQLLENDQQSAGLVGGCIIVLNEVPR